MPGLAQPRDPAGFLEEAFAPVLRGAKDAVQHFDRHAAVELPVVAEVHRPQSRPCPKCAKPGSGRRRGEGLWRPMASPAGCAGQATGRCSVQNRLTALSDQ